jgi:hypothetical protein
MGGVASHLVRGDDRQEADDVGRDKEPARQSRRGPDRQLAVAAALALVAALAIGAIVLVSSVAPASSLSPSATPSGTTLPSGGISRDRAIEIASGTTAGQTPAGFRATATATFDDGYGRWVWQVTWTQYGGPTGGDGCEVAVDLMSGQVLHRSCWVS